MQFITNQLKKAKNFIFGEDVLFKDDEDNNKMYAEFRGAIPLNKATVGFEKPHTWRYYDYGDTNKAPIICIPPAGGSADVFFKLMNLLPGKGIRIASVQSPEVAGYDDWIESFSLFLDHLQLKKVHLLGCGLGGFLSLLFARAHSDRVLSLILINAYAVNAVFVQSTAKFEFAPAFILRNVMAKSFQEVGTEANLASVSFFKKHMEDLDQLELYSHINLEMGEAFIDKRKVNPETTTILESDDYLSLPPLAVNSLKQAFPTARYVQLKKGGDFPYISESEEIALHIVVHLRRLDQSLLPVQVLSQLPDYASDAYKSEKAQTERVGIVPVDDSSSSSSPSSSSSSSSEVGERDLSSSSSSSSDIPTSASDPSSSSSSSSSETAPSASSSSPSTTSPSASSSSSSLEADSAGSSTTSSSSPGFSSDSSADSNIEENENGTV